MDLIEFLLSKDIGWFYANFVCVLSMLGGMFVFVCFLGWVFGRFFNPKKRRW